MNAEHRAAIYKEVLQGTFMIRQRIAKLESERRGKKNDKASEKKHDELVGEMIDAAEVHARLAHAVLEEADDSIEYFETFNSANKRGLKIVPSEEGDDDEEEESI